MGTMTWQVADAEIKNGQMTRISTGEVLISERDLPKWKWDEILRYIGKLAKERGYEA